MYLATRPAGGPQALVPDPADTAAALDAAAAAAARRAEAAAEEELERVRGRLATANLQVNAVRRPAGVRRLELGLREPRRPSGGTCGPAERESCPCWPRAV